MAKLVISGDALLTLIGAVSGRRERRARRAAARSAAPIRKQTELPLDSGGYFAQKWVSQDGRFTEGPHNVVVPSVYDDQAALREFPMVYYHEEYNALKSFYRPGKVVYWRLYRQQGNSARLIADWNTTMVDQKKRAEWTALFNPRRLASL